MGEALILRMMHYGRNHHERGVQKFVTDYKALNQIAQKYIWLTILFCEIAEESNEYGARLTAHQKNIETKLNCLEDDEAKIIGAALMLIVASSVNASTGVRIWIDKYAAMKELCTEHQFLIPLFETVATRMATKVDWKMMSKACVTGLISILDMASDIYMIWFYYQTDQVFYGNATLIEIVRCILLQCLAVSGLYKNDKKAMKQELFNVLTFVKVGRAQFQVLKQKDNQGCNVPAELEYSLFKSIELVAEAIPCTLLQVFALVESQNERSAVQIGSLLISAFVTGHSASMMTYIMDTSSAKRSEIGK